MSRAYYNEFDPYVADWLRRLVLSGLIPAGDVDTRSIVDVSAADLTGYTQCHFFAGIGGWSRALRLANWPDERPVWTGSCPCQPFANTGKRKGFEDPRHLWPEFKRLIEKRSPSVVFGEQSADASAWLSLVHGDLEAMGYAVGAIPLEAASADADHFRDRYFFVADYDNAEWRSDHSAGNQPDWQEAGRDQDAGDVAERSPGLVEHASSLGWGQGWTEHEFRSRGFAAPVASVRGKQFVQCPGGKWRALPPPRVRWLGDGIPARVDKLRGLGNAIDPRPAAEFIRAYMSTLSVSEVAA